MPTTTRRSLARDRSGAILVLGVFMAALMVGFIYYVKGIADAIGFRERMQDAADSAVFAAATTCARAMNLIALINICMVVVLAMSATARLIVYMAALAGAGGAGGKAGGIEGPALHVLMTAQATSEALAEALPAAAEARAAAAAGGAFRPPVKSIFAYPAPRLPIENAGAGELLARAGGAHFPVAMHAFTYQEMNKIYQKTTGTALTNYGASSASAILAGSNVGPQQLLPGATRGGQMFQVDIVVAGEFHHTLAEKGVGIAAWGETEDAGENIRALASAARISLAQAEFYYDGDEGRNEWIWHQNWRARMRRVRVGDPGHYPCRARSDACDALDRFFQRGLNRAVVH
jgi:hypothetical protein